MGTARLFFENMTLRVNMSQSLFSPPPVMVQRSMPQILRAVMTESGYGEFANRINIAIAPSTSKMQKFQTVYSLVHFAALGILVLAIALCFAGVYLQHPFVILGMTGGGFPLCLICGCLAGCKFDGAMEEFRAALHEELNRQSHQHSGISFRLADEVTPANAEDVERRIPYIEASFGGGAPGFGGGALGFGGDVPLITGAEATTPGIGGGGYPGAHAQYHAVPNSGADGPCGCSIA